MRILIIILCVLFFGCSEKDKLGTVTEEVGVYNNKLEKILTKDTLSPFVLYKGAVVKLVDKNGCPAKDGSEKMVLVMLQNKLGDFVNNYKACVPERKIKWD